MSRNAIIPQHVLSCAGAAFFAAALAANWSALLLAELGRFHGGPPLVIGLAAASCFFWLGLRRPAEALAGEPLWPAVAAVVVAVASLWLTTPPGEMILGGWDPGVYLHTAAGIVQQHQLQFFFPDLLKVSAEEWPLVFRDLHRIPEPYGGMRMLPNGWITPQFHHAYPALLAVAWSFAGLRGALLVNPLLNVACLLALFALVRRLLGSRWALAAVVVMALNPAQLWQAKFSTAETLGQFYLLGGIAFWLSPVSRRPHAARESVLTGAALGLALLTRYDVILFAAPMLAWLFFSFADNPQRRKTLLMISVFGALCVQAWWHQQVVAPYYSPLHKQLLPCLAAAALLAGVWLLVRRCAAGAAVARWMRRRDLHARAVLAAGFAGWVLFAWLVRPALDTARWDARVIEKILLGLDLAGVHAFLAGREASNMHYLAAMFSSPGLALGLAGIAWMILRMRGLNERAWLYPAVLVLIVLTTSVFHDHFMMWVSRRYIPVVVPLITVGLVAAAAGARRGLRRRPGLGRAVAAIVLVVPVLWVLPSSAVIARTRDWPGLVAWFDALHAALPRGAAIYSDQPGFAAPLRFLYGRNAFELHFPKPDKYERLFRILAEKAGRGGRIFYLSENPPWPPAGVQFRTEAAFPLKSSILDHARSRVPTGVKPRDADFVLYRVAREKKTGGDMATPAGTE